MNNPFAMLVQLAQSGGNPTAMLNRMVQQNPQMGQVIQMMQGKSQRELAQIAQSIAAQKGVDINALCRNLGIK